MKKSFIGGCILGVATAAIALYFKDHPKTLTSAKEAVKTTLAGLLPKQDDEVEPVTLKED